MLKNIKHLIKHSLIYSISNITLKSSGVILLPIYTHYFTVEEYGRLGLILIIIVLFSQSLILGQGISIIRYNNSSEFSSKKKSILFTLTVLVLITVIVFILISESFLTQISGWFGEVNLYKDFLNIAIYIIAFTTINNLFLSKVRADDNSVLYTLSTVVKVILMVLLSIYLIVERRFGIDGVLYSQLAGEALQTLVVLPKIIQQMKLKFEYSIIAKSLRFGIPLIFSAMAINLLNGSDRFMLKFLSGETELGLYELGYKVAGVVNMFVIMPFGLTLMPLAYKLYKKDGDKEYYKKLKTYVAFVLAWSGLALSLYGKELVELFAQQEAYYPASVVVPLIVLAYVIYGISMISTLGMYLTGNNYYVAYITLFCAGLNIGLNFWLIPLYGIIGAAINTVIAFAALDIFVNIASNKYYKIDYEHFKLIKLFILGILIFWGSVYLNNIQLFLRIFLKLILIVLFPFILILSGYFDRVELNSISGAIKKWRNPMKWKFNLESEKLDKEKPDNLNNNNL
ncbi:MAG: polysaccharide biosynthesis C-terminal domain-containing protein [Ignavibacteriaceae bacterium]|nr:polysaccharide biosynthesis C-terminal domain-containing protein [Ignavibacteriaceae bacterium]